MSRLTTDRLHLSTFTPLLATPFVVDAASGKVDLRLVSASARNSEISDSEAWVPFNLEFVGPTDPVLPQATYWLRHPTAGDHEIFIVPIGQDADGTHYEAIFG